MNVGLVRSLIAGLADDAEVGIAFSVPPSDDMPGVSLDGFRRSADGKSLVVLVSLEEEEEDEEEWGDEEDEEDDEEEG